MRIGPWRLADGYRVEPFEGQDEIAAADVVAFWEAEGVLSAQEREERVHELLLVARAPDGTLAGVTTAYLEREPQLGATMWWVRGLVGAAHRGSAVGYWLGVRSREVLARRFAEGADTRGSGVLFQLENEELARAFPMAVWPTMGFRFYARNVAGQDLRVHWFDGALAPEPPS
ncbi:hypothetical protein [Paraconexibacter algicola]|uniref:N-acetyltransferase domain-containing protein n=1 Tax=Paraconexibacter algicola TaxID=2133960 RepID=A0A2T4UH01_9ACTN|nr:hypothetical protein [Paraconexibacter algicola]PTL58498.1 hypothetical protein C7Y72_01920 [Paraconexibacter algicola]